MKREYRDIEHRIYQQYGRDGGVELLMGFSFLWCAALIDNNTLFGLIFVLPLSLIPLRRLWLRRISYPRLGYAEIVDQTRSQRRRRQLLFTVVSWSALCVLFLWMWLKKGSTFEPAGFPYISAQEMVKAGLVGAMSGDAWVRRQYQNFVLAFIMSILSGYTDHIGLGMGIPIAATGTLLMLMGLWHARRFVRENPIIEETASDVT